MFRIEEYPEYWRVGALIALGLALLGPWFFDVVHVPAEYPCSAPFVRLQGDFCGVPIRGISLLAFVPAGLVGILDQVLAGDTALSAFTRDFGAMLMAASFMLPFLTSLLLLIRENTLRRQVIHLAAWSLAVVAGVLMLRSSSPSPGWALWGIWLYSGTAVCSFVIEGARLVRFKAIYQG